MEGHPREEERPSSKSWIARSSELRREGQPSLKSVPGPASQGHPGAWPVAVLEGRALWCLKSGFLPLRSLILGFSPQEASRGRGRKWKKQLFAFRVTRAALAPAEKDSFRGPSCLWGTETKIGW